MNKLTKVAAFAVAIASLPVAPGAAQIAASLPITKAVLFSSGVGYFERRGTISGDSLISLAFAADEVNDALKSLVVIDGSSAGEQTGSPSVSYPSRESLDRALKDFRIDLSGSPPVAELLARLRGSEISVDMPETVTGRIVSVESRPIKDSEHSRPYIILLTKGGLRSVSLDDVQALRFSDKGMGEDFDRALSLILTARDERSRSLEVRLPGAGTREAVIGYVIAAPVWKATYRIDFSGDRPQLQGWALVDNPSNQDWKSVALSLISGKPVSFIQDLYAPLYLDRPTIPVAIAGIAAAQSFDSGFTEGLRNRIADEEAPAMIKKAEMRLAVPSPAPPDGPSFTASAQMQGALGLMQAQNTTTGSKAGDQFQFTIKKPVSLERGRSAMLPLVSSEISAERVSVFSPSPADATSSGRLMLGARLSNTTGMRLPAGPIVVFDGGVYAGDALIEFFPEKDSRLIVFGEDLSVLADVSASSSMESVGVSVSKGVITFSRRMTISKTYAFKNVATNTKKIVVEHPITPGTELYEPKSSDEKTESVYRFSLTLPAASERKIIVKERSPRRESVLLSSLRTDDFLAYSSSQEIPEIIRAALKKAIELRRILEDAKKTVTETRSRKGGLVDDQSRFRENLDAVGRDSSQGQQYLKRLMDTEATIDLTNNEMLDAEKSQQAAQSNYENYLANLSL